LKKQVTSIAQVPKKCKQAVKMEINFDNVCRLCSREAECEGKDLQLIFDYEFEGVPLIDIIQQVCFKITRIEQEDNFSHSICAECLVILCNAYKLCETSVATEKEFNAVIFEQIDIKKEELDASYNEILKLEDSTGAEEGVEEEGESLNLCEIKEPDNDYQYDEEDEEEDTDEDTDEEKFKPAVSSAKRKKVIVKRHKCNVCEKLFEKPSKLARHLKVHDVNKKPFACEHPNCHSRFLTQAALQRHGIIHSGMTIQIGPDPNKKYECVVCQKEFQAQEAMASHMRQHKDVMATLEFPCNLCDKTFKRLNELVSFLIMIDPSFGLLLLLFSRHDTHEHTQKTKIINAKYVTRQVVVANNPLDSRELIYSLSGFLTRISSD